MLRLGVAEDRAQKAAALLGLTVFALAGFQLADTLFEFLDVVGGCLKPLFLNDDGLGQVIGGGGLFARRLVDQGLGVAVARCGRGGAYAVEEGGQQLAFFG